MNPKLDAIITGIVGVATQSVCLAVSMASVKEWLQIASLVVGIIVGLLTIYKLLRGK